MTMTTEHPSTVRPLTGRRALVTGGARGIGAGIVQRLAADGAAVALTYSASATAAEKLVAQVEAEGATAVAIHADSADPDQVVRSVDETVTRLGGLDILVNNAGVATPGDAASFPLAEFDRMVAINIRAVFVATQRALAHLGAGGRIINLGSINADRAPVPYLSVYSMTKAAVAGMTRGLARELASRGITINNLQVGPIATDMNPEVGDFADAMRATMAIDDYGHPADVARVVSFLVGPESGYITGVNWNVDGGFTA